MQSSGRLTELDAMRGVASLAVVVGHAIYNLPSRDLPIIRIMTTTPLRPFIDGRLAVIFFFVLSGLVLTRALLADHRRGFAVYAIRRVIRLCLPVAAVAMLSAILYVACHAPEAAPNPTGWLRIAGWGDVPSPWSVFRQATLIGVDGQFQLDPVLWTLVHELRFSLLLPLVIVLVAKWDPCGGMLLLTAGSLLFGLQIGDRLAAGAMLPSLTYLALQTAIFVWVASRASLLQSIFLSTSQSVAARWKPLGGCVVAGIVFGWHYSDGGTVMLGNNLAEGVMATLYFLPCFLVGAALSFGSMERFAPASNGRVRCIVGAVALLCFDNIFATVAAATLLILLAGQPGRLRTLLRTGPLVFLGRVSFSVYLVHLPLLFALSYALRNALPGAAINAVWVILVVPAAWMFYRVVELPAQRLARRIGRSPMVAAA
jgi:peptidoglycan/LPS O-acetylase OafA/YrhL